MKTKFSKKSKFLALLLSLAVIFGSLPVTAMVDSTDALTVIFVCNNGEEPVSKEFEEHEGSYTLLYSPEPTKSYYSFKCWNTRDDGTGDEYEHGDEFSSDMTLYAQWEPITYELIYDSNGGMGNMENTQHTIENPGKIRLNTFTKDYYDFVAWNTKNDSTGNSFTDGEDNFNFSDLFDPTEPYETTLYAQWEGEEYGINYVLNGGTGTLTPVTYTVEDSVTLPSSITKTGYTFAGWYESADFSGSAVTTIPQGTTGDKDFYAKWAAESYTIAYHTNGGTGTLNPTSYTIEDSVTLPSSITKTGYTFAGWYESADFSGSAVTKIDKGTTGDKEYYAKWISNPDPTPATTKYTITATATDGGTIAPSGEVKVEEGKSQSFTATADDDYTLEKFVVDGKDEYIDGNTYTFDKVAKNHTIQAVFAKKGFYSQNRKKYDIIVIWKRR